MDAVRAGVAAAAVYATLRAAGKGASERQLPAFKTQQEHDADVTRVQKQMRDFLTHRKPDERVSVKRVASNGYVGNRIEQPSFNNTRRRIDVSSLTRILRIDAHARQAVVEPGVPMDELLRVSLAFGMMPLVVPEFPGITVGGAISGGGIESTSHRNGHFHDCVISLDVMLGDGRVERDVSASNQPDLFRALKLTLGTVGIIVGVRIRLEPASPYVRVRLLHFPSADAALSAMDSMCNAEKPPDFVDAVVIRENSALVIAGFKTTQLPRHQPGREGEAPSLVSLRNSRWDEWWWWHLRDKAASMATIPDNVSSRALHEAVFSAAEGVGTLDEYLSTGDYLFRFDRGAFWMAEPGLEAFWGERYYNAVCRFKYAWLCTTRQLYRALHALPGDLVARSFVVQDFHLPDSQTTANMVKYAIARTQIRPIWLLPIRFHGNSAPGLPHQGGATRQLAYNLGLYGVPNKGQPFDPVALNRELETMLASLGGTKMLYAKAYYSPREFWAHCHYDRREYEAIRRHYRAEGVLHDISTKFLSPEQILKQLEGEKRVDLARDGFSPLMRWYARGWGQMLLPPLLWKPLGINHVDQFAYRADDANADPAMPRIRAKL